jgi:hypothetical protein
VGISARRVEVAFACLSSWNDILPQRGSRRFVALLLTREATTRLCTGTPKAYCRTEKSRAHPEAFSVARYILAGIGSRTTLSGSFA